MNKYVDEIWSLHEKYYYTPGMDNYGRGWELQREYYRKLPLLEKRKYEDAVLMLCQSKDIQKAIFGLATCSELADIFSDDWADRVVPLVEELVKTSLQPVYKNATSYYVLSLIWEFNIRSLIPFVKEFREKITMNLKRGILPLGEWEPLYGQVSRILIKVSPEDFWKEFITFHQDRELLDLLGFETKAVIYTWTSFGALTYGLGWLSKFVTEYSKYSDQTLKEQALLSIEQSFGIVVSQNPAIRESKGKFVEWARDQLI